MHVHDALAAHHRPATMPQAAAHRVAISIGNAGALGEAVLARLLAAPQYRQIYVATILPLRTTAPRLYPIDYAGLATEDAWQPDADRPAPIRDAVLIVGGQHSYFRRDDAFPILTEPEAIKLARRARQNHCTRMMVIAPMDAWTAMTLGALAHFDDLEREIGAMGFDTLVVVRPATHARGTQRGNWLDRLAHGMISALTQYMTGTSRQPLRAQIVAQAAVEWFTTLPPGHHRQDAAALHAWLENRKAPAR